MTRAEGTYWIAATSAVLLIGIAVVASASPATIPHTFTPHTLADANQMNANFQALKTAVDDNHARITGLETQPVDAATLGGLAGNELVRASYAQNTTTLSGISGATPQAFLTHDVTVPASGVLMIWGMLSVETASTGTDYARLFAYLTAGGAEVGVQVEQDYDEESHSYDTSSLALSVAVPVTAGTLTVEIQGHVLETGDCDLWIKERSLTTLFVPFGDTGGQGALKPMLLGAPRYGRDPSDDR